jgi:hypothetical protein
MKFRRLMASAAAVVSAVLCTIVLVGPPAFADGSASSLSPAAGHTCTEVASFPHGTFEGFFCVELAIYTTSAGAHYVTAQIEVACPKPDTVVQPCVREDIHGEIANGAKNITGGEKRCSGDCPADPGSARTYLYPFGGLPAPTTVGGCDNNVWGVVEASSSVDLGGSEYAFPNSDLGTPHYNVCRTSSGYKFTKI